MTNLNLYGGGMDATLPPEIQILQLASAHVASRAIHTFVSHGLADIVDATPRPVSEIAERSRLQAPELYRLLRFLSTIGVVSEDNHQQFSTTKLGAALRPSGVPVVRDNVHLIGSDFYWNALADLGHQLQTGNVAFELKTGKSFFEHVSASEADSGVFNRAMDSLSSINIPSILAAYDFTAASRIVDIAGGKGALLSGILAKYPNARGVLFDFQNVVDAAVFEPSIAGRIDRMGGSFFEQLPPSGDVYILRQILHNWNDDDASRILRRCREAMRPSGRLIIIEMTPPDTQNQGSDWAALDILMMILLGGKERTLKDFEALFQETGLQVARVVATRSAFSIIECVPQVTQHSPT